MCCPQHPPLGLNFTTSLECRAGSLPQWVPVAAVSAPATCRSACSLKRDTSDRGHPLKAIFPVAQSIPEPEAEQLCPANQQLCTKDPPDQILPFNFKSEERGSLHQNCSTNQRRQESNQNNSKICHLLFPLPTKQLDILPQGVSGA